MPKQILARKLEKPFAITNLAQNVNALSVVSNSSRFSLRFCLLFSSSLNMLGNSTKYKTANIKMEIEYLKKINLSQKCIKY